MTEGRAPSDTAASAEPDLLQRTNEREKEVFDSVTTINDREWVIIKQIVLKWLLQSKRCLSVSRKAMNRRLRSVIIFLVCAAHKNEIKKFFCNGQVLSVNGVPAYGKGRLMKVIEHLYSTVYCEAEKVQTHAESWFLWQTHIHLLTALMFDVCQVFKHLQQKLQKSGFLVHRDLVCEILGES